MIYIAFLRAINVGGRTVKMERLRELFTALGLANVRTYIQTGNVFFETAERDRAALTQRIERHLQQELGYEVATMLRTMPEVEQLLTLDPFAGIEATPDTRFCLLFTSQALPADLALPLVAPKGGGEVVAVAGSDACVVVRLKEGRMGNPTAFIEKTFRVKATARFFATTAKILEAAKRA